MELMRMGCADDDDRRRGAEAAGSRGRGHRRSGSGDEVRGAGSASRLATDQAMLGDLTRGNETWACVKLIEKLQREPRGGAEVQFCIQSYLPRTVGLRVDWQGSCSSAELCMDILRIRRICDRTGSHNLLRRS